MTTASQPSQADQQGSLKRSTWCRYDAMLASAMLIGLLALALWQQQSTTKPAIQSPLVPPIALIKSITVPPPAAAITIARRPLPPPPGLPEQPTSTPLLPAAEALSLVKGLEPLAAEEASLEPNRELQPLRIEPSPPLASPPALRAVSPLAQADKPMRPLSSALSLKPIEAPHPTLPLSNTLKTTPAPVAAPLPASALSPSKDALSQTTMGTANATDAALMRRGRALLHMVSAGRSPLIAVRWPTTAAQRAKLYRLLRRCYGMTLAYRSKDDGRLWVEGEASNASNHRNSLARYYSPLLRSVEGTPIALEERDRRRLRQQQQVPVSALPLRLLPRAVDALLVGGLGHAAGGRFSGSGTISAAYRQLDNQVWVEAIVIDGHRSEVRIDLSPAATVECS